MEVVSGDSWSYKTCKAPVRMSPLTNQHPVFFTGRIPFLSPNQRCQSSEWKFQLLLTVNNSVTVSRKINANHELKRSAFSHVCAYSSPSILFSVYL